jgi:hypothetical protein
VDWAGVFFFISIAYVRMGGGLFIAELVCALKI